MSRSLHPIVSSLADCVGILLALALAGLWDDASASGLGPLIVALMFALVWLVIANRIGAYRVPPSRNLALSLRRMTEAWCASWGIAGVLSLSTVSNTHFSIWLALVAGLTALTVLRMTFAITRWGKVAGRTRALVIGSCTSARAVSNTDPAADMEVVGLVMFTNETATAMPHLRQLGTIDALPQILRQHEIDVAVVSPSDAALTGEVRTVFRTCSDLGLAVQYFPSFLDVDHLRVNLTWSADRPGLNVQNLTTPTVAHLCKRAIDVVGAGFGLIALLPVLAACALGVKLTSPGPVFFRQERVGMGERRFQCLKFRTMRVGAHAQQDLLRSSSSQDGPAFKMASDPRITRIGRLLRKFSLDELPQLINVLVGDMSLVGPRPPIPTEVDRYLWWQRRRVSVKPGLTCLWQVYGRNRVSFKRWVEMDLFYIDNWSLWLDLKLIAHTFRAVLRGTGM